MEIERTSPLAGVVVVDLTRVLSGPFCTMLLGDLGARVIKVEEPNTGDETRRWGPPFVGGESAYFLSVNRNKESVALDLRNDRDVSALRDLIKHSDVFVENFRPGVAARLGLDFDRLSADNPRLIYASISGFGQTGPDSLRPGYDLIIQALSGLMYASGAGENSPSKTALPASDVLAALFTTVGIISALFERASTGKGRYLEVSLLDSLLAGMSSVSSMYLLTGKTPPPMGNAQPNIVPYQVFRCPDGPIVAGAPNQRIWHRFCEALERPEWIADPRYADNRERIRHHAVLEAEIEAVLQSRPRAEWLQRFAAYDVPSAPIQSVNETFAMPHIVDRDTAVRFDDPDGTAMSVVGCPIRFGGSKARCDRPPRLGEHTEAVFGAGAASVNHRPLRAAAASTGEDGHDLPASCAQAINARTNGDR